MPRQAPIKLKAIFSELLPGFGVSHAKVYFFLLSGEVKTATQLSRESLVPVNKVYVALNDLLRHGLVHCTNSHPANYFSKNPVKAFEKLVKRKTSFLARRAVELEGILKQSLQAEEQTYLIRINGENKKIEDFKNKVPVKDERELKEMKKTIEEALEKTNGKKVYGYAVYR